MLKGEYKTKKEAEVALKEYQKEKGQYRIVPNTCGAEKEKFPFLIQMKDESEESGWLCLHD